MNASHPLRNTYLFPMNEKRQDVSLLTPYALTGLLEALKIAIEAKMKKQSMYTKGDISQLTSTRFHKNDTSNLNKASSKKILPPIASTQTLAQDLMSSTMNSKALRLDTLSPPHAKAISKKAGFAATTTNKDGKFFITSQAPLQAHYLNETTGEPSMIDKAAVT